MINLKVIKHHHRRRLSMKWLILALFLIGPINDAIAGVCEDKYPPIKTMITKPIKVAYTAIVKVPVKVVGRCSEKRWKKIKKKPWKIFSEPYTFWYDCTKTTYKDIKEKRYRDEFKEIEELKDTPEFLKCIAKEKDLESALKTMLLISNPINGILTNVVIDNILVSDKKSTTSISEKNLNELKESFTVISKGRALTYQTLYRGNVSMDIYEYVKSRETVIHKSTNCNHRIRQKLEWTNPCLVDNRPVHQYEDDKHLNFSCEKDFKHNKTFDRGLEPGVAGDTLKNNDNCGKIYSYIMGKFANEKVKLNQLIKDQASAISNIQFSSLNKPLQGDGDE